MEILNTGFICLVVMAMFVFIDIFIVKPIYEKKLARGYELMRRAQLHKFAIELAQHNTDRNEVYMASLTTHHTVTWLSLLDFFATLECDGVKRNLYDLMNELHRQLLGYIKRYHNRHTYSHESYAVTTSIKDHLIELEADAKRRFGFNTDFFENDLYTVAELRDHLIDENLCLEIENKRILSPYYLFDIGTLKPREPIVPGLKKYNYGLILCRTEIFIERRAEYLRKRAKRSKLDLSRRFLYSNRVY